MVPLPPTFAFCIMRSCGSTLTLSRYTQNAHMTRKKYLRGACGLGFRVKGLGRACMVVRGIRRTPTWRKKYLHGGAWWCMGCMVHGACMGCMVVHGACMARAWWRHGKRVVTSLVSQERHKPPMHGMARAWHGTCKARTMHHHARTSVHPMHGTRV
jgi:hypothetical protein